MLDSSLLAPLLWRATATCESTTCDAHLDRLCDCLPPSNIHLVPNPENRWSILLGGRGHKAPGTRKRNGLMTWNRFLPCRIRCKTRPLHDHRLAIDSGRFPLLKNMR